LGVADGLTESGHRQRLDRGAPAHLPERIFGMLERLDPAFEGTGIGFALVKRAVERMGGRVGGRIRHRRRQPPAGLAKPKE
jgi:hypothetical protein